VVRYHEFWVSAAATTITTTTTARQDDRMDRIRANVAWLSGRPGCDAPPNASSSQTALLKSCPSCHPVLSLSSFFGDVGGAGGSAAMTDRLRGTLELLVLRTLTWGPAHEAATGLSCSTQSVVRQQYPVTAARRQLPGGSCQLSVTSSGDEYSRTDLLSVRCGW